RAEVPAGGGRVVGGEHRGGVGGVRRGAPGRERVPPLAGGREGLGEPVADAGERELPPVGRGAQELREQRQRDGLVTAAAHGSGAGLQLDPSVHGGDVGAALAGEREVDLQVGGDAGGQPPEQLADVAVAVDERGVALLGADGRRLQVRADAGDGRAVELQRPDDRLARQVRQQREGQLRVVRRVVDVPGERV